MTDDDIELVKRAMCCGVGRKCIAEEMSDAYQCRSNCTSATFARKAEVAVAALEAAGWRKVPVMEYFVLKPAGDNAYAKAARDAMVTYARSIYYVDPELSKTLWGWEEHEAAANEKPAERGGI